MIMKEKINLLAIKVKTNFSIVKTKVKILYIIGSITCITDNFLDAFISPFDDEIGVDLNCELPVINLEDLKVIETNLDLCWGLPCNMQRDPSRTFVNICR